MAERREAPSPATQALWDAGWRVERVTEATWRTYRDIRVAALIDMPQAFGSSYEQARALADEEVVERVTTSPHWLALQGERPVGTVALWAAPHLEPGGQMLVGLWIAGAMRGSGVGGDLVEAALGWARDQGAPRVVLHVMEGNEVARQRFEGIGFRPTGRMVPTANPQVSEVEYELDPAGPWVAHRVT